MLGRMADEIYDVVPAGTAGAVGPVRRKYATPMYTNITPTDELVQIQKRLERPIPTGGLVYYPIEDYHLTVPSGELTATLFYCPVFLVLRQNWG